MSGDSEFEGGQPPTPHDSTHRQRRMQIINASENYSPDSEDIAQVVPKTEAARAVLVAALRAHFLFSSLEEDDLSRMVDPMSSLTKLAGEDIIRQGDIGTEFFCLEQGTAEVFVDGQKVATYAPGSSFGQLALIYNDRRAATVRASSDCILWVLGLRTFRRILASTSAAKMMARCEFLKRVPILQPLSNEQVSKLAGALSPVSFHGGEYIIRQGDQGDMFYIIKSGRVRCTQSRAGSQDMILLDLDAGDYFGEMALMLDEPRHANCIAIGEVHCFALGRSNFVELLGPLRELLNSRMRIRILKSVPLLSHLTEEQLDSVGEVMRVQAFRNGDYIIRQGDEGSRFYIINEGMVCCTQSTPETSEERELIRLGPQEFFGERALIKREPRKANVVAVGEVECLVLERSDFTSMLAQVQSLMVQEMAKRELLTPRIAAFARDIIHTPGQSTHYQFSELRQMRTIGTGTFGRVKLVQHIPTERVCALKCLNKADVVASHQEKNVMNEKNILFEVKHPFVLELLQTFDSPNQIFMLMELAQGGELFAYLYKRPDCIRRNARGGFETEAAKFYAACVILAFQHIHSMGIAYRDLKPENILIDHEGYCKVGDFGFAKHIPFVKNDVSQTKTFTLCGTPEYLAPEVILSSGHDKAVDLWALGCLVYELIMARTPFQDEHQPRIFYKIVNSDKCLAFPKNSDRSFEIIVRRMLEPNPAFRLGNLHGGIKDIMDHAYYSSVNWRGMASRQVAAPYMPTIRDTLDVSNFDMHEEDECVPAYTGSQEAFLGF